MYFISYSCHLNIGLMGIYVVFAAGEFLYDKCWPCITSGPCHCISKCCPPSAVEPVWLQKSSMDKSLIFFSPMLELHRDCWGGGKWLAVNNWRYGAVEKNLVC